MLFYFCKVTSPELEESVILLCQLGEGTSDLASQFLDIHKIKLEGDLENISFHTASNEKSGDDILAFVEKCCNSVLNNVALTIATYNNIFPSASLNENK